MITRKVLVEARNPSETLFVVFHVTDAIEQKIHEFQQKARDAGLPDNTHMTLYLPAYDTPIDPHAWETQPLVVSEMQDHQSVTLPADMDLQEDLQCPWNTQVQVGLNGDHFHFTDKYDKTFRNSGWFSLTDEPLKVC